MSSNPLIEQAKEKFGAVIESQLKRIEDMKKGGTPVDYTKLNPIIIGVCFGGCCVE